MTVTNLNLRARIDVRESAIDTSTSVIPIEIRYIDSGGSAVSQATETVAGIAEIATQAEIDARTSDTCIVTPLKLARRANDAVQTIAQSTSALTLDMINGWHADISLSANVTSFSAVNVPSGSVARITLHVLPSGSYGITNWPGTVYWHNGAAPSFSDGVRTRITLDTTDGGATWWGQYVDVAQPGAELTLTDTDSSSTDQQVYTFSADIGADSGTDTIYLVLTGLTLGGGAQSISSVTVDGVAAASQVQSYADGGTSTGLAAIFTISRNSLPTPANTIVEVIATVSITSRRLALYTCVSPNASGTVYDSATAAGTADGNPETYDLDLNAPANGLVIGTAMSANPSVGFTWTGLTEQSQDIIENNAYVIAFDGSVPAATPRTVSCYVSARWAPALVTASFELS